MKNLIWILVAIPFVLSHFSQADSRSAYYDALKIAQAKVERGKHPLGGGPAALSPSLIGQFLGRPYKVGDSWNVAVWASDSTIMRQTSESERMKSLHGRGGIFRYDVVATRGPEVDLRVTQLDTPGTPAIDSRVRSISLTVSTANGFTPSKKSYQMADGKKDFNASPEGLHAPVSYLELLPLEAPELTTAVRSEVKAVPELPAELKQLAGNAPLALDPAHAAQFEQDDFFGRSVEAIWRQGDPWPVYLKTANGVAVLIVATSGGSQ